MPPVQPPSSPVDKTALFLSVKQLGHEHDHPSRSSAKIKNMRSFNSTPLSTSTGWCFNIWIACLLEFIQVYMELLNVLVVIYVSFRSKKTKGLHQICIGNAAYTVLKLWDTNHAACCRNTTVYNQMCEINLVKVFGAIHRLALLQENRVFQGLDPSLSSGDPNLLDQSGKDGLYHWARSSLRNIVLFF